MGNIEKIYRKLKKVPILGVILVFLRNIIRSPYFERKRLKTINKKD